jgi:hypothetical protein
VAGGFGLRSNNRVASSVNSGVIISPSRELIQISAM